MQLVQKNSRRRQLKTLDQQIGERKRYLRKQEALIDDLIESGNTQLMGLNHDILMAQQELRHIKTDIRTAAQDRILINEDLEIMRIEAGMLIVPTMFIGVSPVFG